MKIETKFDVGQWVWLIRSDLTENRCSKCGHGAREEMWSLLRQEEVYGIETNSEADQVSSVLYRFRKSGITDEDNLFVRKTEAQAECDRRNGKGKS